MSEKMTEQELIEWAKSTARDAPRLMTDEEFALHMRRLDNDGFDDGDLGRVMADWAKTRELLEDKSRTVASFAVMLGWSNTPPRETLEATLRAERRLAKTQYEQLQAENQKLVAKLAVRGADGPSSHTCPSALVEVPVCATCMEPFLSPEDLRNVAAARPHPFKARATKPAYCDLCNRPEQVELHSLERA